MSYTVLSRKWRPKIFDDIIGQNHITTTLKEIIIDTNMSFKLNRVKFKIKSYKRLHKSYKSI